MGEVVEIGGIVASGLLALFLGTLLLYRRRFARSGEAVRRASALFYHGEGRRKRGFVPAIAVLIEKASYLLYAGAGRDIRYRGFIRVYGIFLSISIGYTVSFFFISWILGGSGSVGQVDIYEKWSFEDGRLQLLGLMAAFAVVLVLVLSDYDRSEAIARKIFSKILFERAFDIFSVIFTFAVVYYTIYEGTELDVIPPSWVDPLESKAVSAFVAATLAALFVATSVTKIMGMTWGSLAGVAFWLDVPIIIVFPFALIISVIVSGFWPLVISGVLVPSVLIAYFGFDGHLLDTGRYIVAAALAAPLAAAVYQNCAPYYKEHHGNVVFAILLAAITLVVLSFALALKDSATNRDIAYFVLFFWLMLPLCNAIWDALSWSVTWELLTRLRERLDELGRRPRSLGAEIRKALLFLAHLLFEIVAASAAFFGVAVSIFLVFFWSNSFILRDGEEVVADYPIDIIGITSAFIENPLSGDGFWMATLLLSTLLPTVLHLIVVSVGSADLVARSDRIQNDLRIAAAAPGSAALDRAAAGRLALYVAKLLVASVATLCAAGALIWVLSNAFGAKLLCEFAHFFADRSAPVEGLVCERL